MGNEGRHQIVNAFLIVLGAVLVFCGVIALMSRWQQRRDDDLFRKFRGGAPTVKTSPELRRLMARNIEERLQPRTRKDERRE